MSASTQHRAHADRHPEPVQAASFRLAPVPLAPRRGRHLVRQVLEGRGQDAVDRIELLVSELVTNSIRHGRLGSEDLVEIRVRVEPHRARVEVSDPGSRFQPDARPSAGGSSKWGLYLIDQIADRWGMSDLERGKVLWFEVAL
jgi:serine/threonine-protein kinase RsbW